MSTRRVVFFDAAAPTPDSGGSGGGHAEAAAAAAATDGLLASGLPAVEASQDDPLVLHAALADLRQMLERERTLGRRQMERLQRACTALEEHGIALPRDEQVGGKVEGPAALGKVKEEREDMEAIPAPPSDLRGVEHPSIVTESVEHHFQSMARALRSAKFNSETVVRLQELSFHVRVPRSAKPLPTVTEALASPFLQILNWRKEKETRTITILDRVSAVFEPGKSYLVLGPPNSGKTTLLKAIAGRLRVPSNGTLDGSITYNGDRADSGRFNLGVVASFVDQQDINEPLLSVRETLEFAGSCVVPKVTEETRQTPYYEVWVRALDLPEAIKSDMLKGKELSPIAHRAAVTAAAKYKTRMVLALLGLKRCADTIVGNERIRGISGGERRRLTLGEMLMTWSSIACWDEISTGLDAAATHDIALMTRAVVKAFKTTCIVSLLQPPPEVVNLFDELVIMAEGRLVYQGPVPETGPYFARLGYPCPTNKALTDFLIDIHCPHARAEYLQLLAARQRRQHHRQPQQGEKFESPPSSCGAGGGCPESSVEFMERYYDEAANPLWAEKKTLLLAAPAPGTHEWKATEVLQYFNSWSTNFVLCLRRERTFLTRDRALFLVNLLQNLVLGALLGSINYHIPITWMEALGQYGALQLLLTLIATKGFAMVPVIFAHRSVYYKQHAARFFQASAYGLATWLVWIGYVALDVLTFGALVYFLVGFTPSVANALVAAGLLFAGGLAMQQLFRTVCYLTPDTLSAIAAMGGLIMLFSIFNGYGIPRPAVPEWWAWIMYANPLFYLFTGLTVNEFNAPRYDPGNRAIHLNMFGLYDDKLWIPLSAAVLLAWVAIYFGLGVLALQRIQYDGTAHAKEKGGNVLVPRRRRTKLGGKAQVEGVGVGVELLPTTMAQGKAGVGDGGAAVAVALPATSAESKAALATVEEDEEMKQQHLPTGPPPAPKQPLATAIAGSTLVPSTESSGESGGWGPVVSVGGSPFPSDDLEAGGGGPGTRLGFSREKTTTMSLPFDPVTLAFRNLTYTVKLASGEPIDLLQGVSGYAKPGSLTALMGSSGAGKTTLLDVLALRKNIGKVTGDLVVNGLPIDPRTYPRMCGYVEQMSLHSPFTTVYEALEFSARLRLSTSVPRDEQDVFIEEVLDTLELRPIRDDIVGLRGRGLSLEELKRLTIAVELCANPSLIYLDEPTSGLDARAATVVARVMKKLAVKGRTVIATIHQPSRAIFSVFDSLLLLKRGGCPVFFGRLGPGAIHLVDYLQSIPGTPRFEEGSNPATYMLECIGAGTSGQEHGDYAAEFGKSSLNLLLQDDLQLLIAPPEMEPEQQAGKPQRNKVPFSSPWLLGAFVCTRRRLRAYSRQPSYNLLRLVTSLFMALLFASVFAPDTRNDKEVISDVTAIAIAMTQLGATGMYLATEVQDMEKPSFTRERSIRMYKISAYTVSWLIAEIPWILVSSLVFAVPFYFLCGYYAGADKFFFFALFHFLYNLWNSLFGHVLGVLFTQQVAQNIVSTLGFLLFSFMGLTRKPDSIPNEYSFLFWGLPSHYMLGGIVETQWHDAEYIVQGTGKTEKDLVLDFIFGGFYRYEYRWVDAGALIGFSAGTVILLWLALRFGRMATR